MFDDDSPDLLVFCFLFFSQLSPLGLFVRRFDLWMVGTGIGFIGYSGLVSDGIGQRFFLLQFQIGLRPPMRAR
jgi:hypothetical protein